MVNEGPPINYAAAGVDYGDMDALKRLAQRAAVVTAKNLTQQGFQEIPRSRGESAYIIDIGSMYLAFTPEGLGTKNLVADAQGEDGYQYYRAGWDTVAMIANDLITVGARPIVISPHWATGSSEWFKNKQRYTALIDGWSDACSEAGAAYGGGETATLTGIIYPETVELSGAGIGIIQQKKRLTLGDKLTEGDHVILIESNGIHANGVSLARKLAKDKLPQGYGTQLPNGKTFGEALLSPTHMYAKLQNALFENGVDIHYMVNITGHGWRKLMRAEGEYTYRMYTVPQPQEEFALMQKTAGLSDQEMYETFNMGAGFAFMVPSQDSARVVEQATNHKLKSWDAGVVEQGPRQVIIEPIGFSYHGDTLRIR